MRNGTKSEHSEPAEIEPTGSNSAETTGSAVLGAGAPVGVTDNPLAADVNEPASVHVIVVAGRTRIVVSGEIDADLGPDLQEAAADAEAAGLPIEVDAQHVTFMDSSGIAFLARLASRSTDRVRVLRAPDPVRFLLEVTKIGELLDLVDDQTPTSGTPGDTNPDDVA